MRIAVENFGPFEQASVEIKPLTILIGKNSVGKSVLTYLIWTLIAATPDFDKLIEIAEEHGADKLAGDAVEKIKHGESPEGELRELIEIFIEALPAAIAAGVRGAIEKAFMTKHWELIRVGADKASIIIEGPKAVLEITLDKDNISAAYRKIYAEFAEELSINVPRMKTLEITYKNIVLYDEHATSVYDIYNAVIAALGGYVVHAFNLFFSTELDVALLPDSRAGVSRTLLKPYLAPAIAEGVSGVDKQFISLHYRLAEYMDKGLIDLDIAKSLFEELGFTPETAFEGGAYTVYAKMWSGKRLHLFQAPSGVRESLTTALALASKEEPRAVIVEEPEAHLHPRAQRLMARLMAKSINKHGKTVIITTHSDYTLYTINNLIALYRNPTRARELNFEEAEALNPEKIAAYLIRAEGNKAVVERLQIGPEGIPEEEFTKIAEELAEERARLLA
ncbi:MULTISPECIES: AAA family ATPase [Pyrobaculum]|jgi:hypothetical protein|uniref:AAA family ATPase n=1 Tax=Pyrobaculum TaxID=2276 RepID=UPI0023F0063D|nr:AAA family ATPase [Pyrobaculum aerophilum]MCX8137785.1 AAA family ATPase [Pyrobaculum aerophilum]